MGDSSQPAAEEAAMTTEIIGERGPLPLSPGKAAEADAEGGGGDDGPLADVVAQVRRHAAETLFHWTALPVALPPSESVRAGLQAADLGAEPAEAEDLMALARGEDGRPMRLSRAQRRSAWATATFGVQSRAYPDQEHVWRLSGLIQQGSVCSKERFFAWMGAGAATLVCYLVPLWLWRGYGFVEGLRQLLKGIRDLFSLLFGLHETKAAVNVRRELERRRRRVALEPVTPAPLPARMPDALQGERVRFDLRPVKNWSEVAKLLRDIEKRLHDAWAVEKFAFVRNVLVERMGLAKDASEQQDAIATAAAEEYNRRFLEAVEGSAALERIAPGLAAAVAETLRVRLVAATLNDEVASEHRAHMRDAREKLVRDHPIKSKSGPWLARQLSLISEAFTKEQNSQKLDRLRVKLLEAHAANEVWLVERLQEFDSTKRKAAKKELKSLREPKRTTKWRMIIWRPSHWKIKKHTNRRGVVSYSCSKMRKMKVKSSWVLWRWWNFLASILCFLNNTLFSLLVLNLFNGPLGVRALLGCRLKFSYSLDFDSDTGTLSPSRHRRWRTFAGRLHAIFKSIKKSVREFEGKPDTGFLGKAFTRVFHRFWNYIVKGFFATLLVLVFQPILTICNVAITLLLVFASVAYIPVASLAVSLFNLFIYDTQKARWGIKVLPIFAILGRIFVVGILQSLFGIVCALLVFPAAAFEVVMAACVRWILRRSWDALMFVVVIAGRGRVPAIETFAARRISGPGMARQHFRQISSETAISVIQTTLDHLELEAYRRQMLRKIDEPRKALKQFLESFLRPLGISFSAESPTCKLLEREAKKTIKALEEASNERRKEIPKLKDRRRFKQSEEELARTLTLAEPVIREFLSARVLPRIGTTPASIADFWRDNELGEIPPEDWTALTRAIICKTFSPDFLQALEETDKTIRLHVTSVRAADFANLVVKGKKLEDPDVVRRVTWANRAMEHAKSRVPQLGKTALTGEAVEVVLPLGGSSWRQMFPEAPPEDDDGDDESRFKAACKAAAVEAAAALAPSPEVAASATVEVKDESAAAAVVAELQQ